MSRATTPRPDPHIRAQNLLLLQATFLHEDEYDDDDQFEGPALSRQSRLEAANFLLDMSSGSWASDEIVHHCSVGCCTSAKESRMELWTAIQARTKQVAKQSFTPKK